MNKKLTTKQEMFIKEYLLDFNATQAAIRAGYNPNSANEQGTQLLAKLSDKIQIAIDERGRQIDITQERIALELAKIAFADMKTYAEFGPDGVMLKNSETVDGTIISEVSETVTKEGGTKRIKLHDKIKALEMLGRYKGMFVDTNKIILPDEPLRAAVLQMTDADLLEKIKEFTQVHPELLADIGKDKE